MSPTTSRLLLATLAFTAGLAGCGETKSIEAPIPDGMTAGQIDVNPVLSPAARAVAVNLADFGLTYDRVRIIVRNSPDTTRIVVDTSLAFSASSSSLTLNLTIPTRRGGQLFSTRVQYLGDAGVLYGGSTVVKSYLPGLERPQPTSLVLNFEGPGAKLKTLTLSPDPLRLVGATTAPMTVTAVDSSGATIAVPPLLFTTSDGSIATVGGTGGSRTVQSFGKRGTARLTATAPNGTTATRDASVTLPAASIAVVSGGGQTSAVGTQLSEPAVVQVNATDGAGVAGVPVTFAAPIGGGVGTVNAVTDADGRASTTMTLATGVGPQSYVATAAGFSVPISVNAVAGPASIATSTITSSVTNIRADNSASAIITLQARDQYGNVITVGGAEVKLTTSLGHFGSVGAVTSIDATDLGNGKYTAQLFGTRGGTATITATIRGAAATSSATVTMTAPAPVGIVRVSGDLSGTVGATLTAPAVVQVNSAEGVGIPDVVVTFSAPAGASVASPTVTTDGYGRASTMITLATGAGSQTFSATTGELSVSIPVTAAAGPPSPATSSVTPNVAQITADNATPVVFTLRTKDRYGNPITTGGATVTFSTTLGRWSTGSATTTAKDAGDGSYTDTLYSAQAGTATISGSVGGSPLTTPKSTISAVAGPLHHFDITLANGSPITGNTQAAVETPVKITARDLTGNLVTSYATTTSVSVANGTLVGGPILTSPSAVGGVISMTVKFGTIGSNVTLKATNGPVAGQSASFNVVAGPPSTVRVNGNSIVYPMGETPTTYPSINVFDVLGNVVANQTVTLGETGPCTLPTPQLTTDAQGTIALNASTLTIPVAGATAPFSCELVVSVGTLPPQRIALLTQPTGATTTVWTGRTDAAWETIDNWTASLPSTTLSAFIAAAQPKSPQAYPVLHGSTVISSIDVEDGARVDLNGNTLSVFQDIDARNTGRIANGTITVPNGANGGAMRGALPNVNCQGGQHTLSGATHVIGALALGDCAIDVAGHELRVDLDLTTAAGSRLVMTQQTSAMQVAGTATFGGTSNQLSAGVLSIFGDFVQTGSATFAPTGTHLVSVGPAPGREQSITFADVTNSWFRNLAVTVVPNHTVTINSPVKILGGLTVSSTGGGALALPFGLANQENGPISITGTMELQLGGVLNASSLTLGRGKVTVTGNGVIAAIRSLRLDSDLELVVNASGTLLGGPPQECTHGTNVTITGSNPGAISTLKTLCGLQ